VSGNGGRNQAFEEVTAQTESAVAYLKEKVAFLESGQPFFLSFFFPLASFHESTLRPLRMAGSENTPAPRGSTSEKDAKEIEQLHKENTKLKNRIKHLLQNYKADEEAAEKEKKHLQDNWRKAEFRVGHLKRALVAEEMLKK